MSTFGPAYDAKLDSKRLGNQFQDIFGLMRDGTFRTLAEISILTAYPESSISAQLRHMRKPQFGSHVVNKRRRGTPERGLWEYQLVANATRWEGRQGLFFCPIDK